MHSIQMTSPTYWLIFGLVIRKLKSSVISYDHCLEVAKQGGITNEDDLNEALHFIHSKMGLISYFSYEGAKDIAFVDP